MNALIPITHADDGAPAVSGRALHEFLGINRDYTNWFKDMTAYGFTAGQDFTPISAKTSAAGGRPRQDHILTLDMAKELSMIQRTERGRQARAYFLECEKRAQQAPAPQWELPQTFAEALRAAADASDRAAAAELQVARDAPKVAYHDDFVCTEDLIRFATVSSTLGITEKRLRELLIDHRWIYRETGTRRSQKTGEKVTTYRYSERADKKPYFQRQEVHDAPRFRGEVMHTLKITPDGAAAIVRAVRRWLDVAPNQTEIEVIPADD